MDVEIKEVKFSEVYHEIEQMLTSNFKESSWHNNNEFDLNKEFLFKMNDSGFYPCFTASVEGKIVGYTAFFLNKHPHVNAFQAYQDVIYVSPEHRKTKSCVAPFLLGYAENALRSKGAKYILCGAPVSQGQAYRKMLYRCGYSEVDVLMGKRF
jgi:hypothetical protein